MSNFSRSVTCPKSLQESTLLSQLTVKCTEASSHEGGQVALNQPFLQVFRPRCGLNNVEQPRTSKITSSSPVVNIVHQEIEQRELIFPCSSCEFRPDGA